jgi:S1-C subfamily serine protease
VPRYIALWIGILCGFVAALLWPHEDVGSRLLKQVGSQVFMMTPPSTLTTGGTGFALKMPSGRVLTVTNAHVCRLAENGVLKATPNGSGRGFLIRVLEISTTADLCILDSVPGARGLELAAGVSDFEPIYALGHPHLEGNTLTRGYITGRHEINIMGDTVELQRFEAMLTSVVIFGGNSGSPALNESGQVVGVFFAGDASTNYGLFVPYDFLRSFGIIY